MPLLGTQTNIQAWYSDYRRYPFYAARAAWINEVQSTGKILVAGAGFGYLVDELTALGRDVYGFDAADYCVNNSAPHTTKADIMNRSQLASVKNTMNVTGINKIPCIITDDLLPCLTDAEITTALSEARRIATVLLHIITPGDPNDSTKVVGMNWKLIEDWKSIVGNDLIYNTESAQVL